MSDIALIGLAVMGENLVMNMERNGFSVSVYNRTTTKVDDFLKGSAKGKNIKGAYSLEELVSQLDKPRKIMIMVKAGQPVDDIIEELIPLLDAGDVIIDGGNSNSIDTERRTKYVESKDLLYIGVGVSGGEEGALKGPSMMPGGSSEAWSLVKPIFQSICAKVDNAACCEWVGNGGAGHFVKMVHNGIEYGDMQLICEVYQIMRDYLGMNNAEIQSTFFEWNKGKLDSYLIEITADIFGYLDENGEAIIDKILDVAGQKGTGKWTGISALENGVPLTLIVEAVFSRFLSSLKSERVEASSILNGPQVKFTGKTEEFLEDLHDALYASKIVSYAQGYNLMRTVSDNNGWNLQYGDIALMWRGGCIIRSAFLGKIKIAFDAKPNLKNLLLDDYFKGEIEKSQVGWRNIVSESAKIGLPMPAISSALSYYDGYRCANLPANLLQAQRDYFGAHTYERIDYPRGKFFHTNWTGEGGATSASIYDV